MQSSYFSSAFTYVRTKKWEFCSDACTLASKLFADHYLTKAEQRVKLRISELKKGNG